MRELLWEFLSTGQSHEQQDKLFESTGTTKHTPWRRDDPSSWGDELFNDPSAVRDLRVECIPLDGRL